MGDSVDLLVVGGGINGAAIARDAAGRGLAVLLCEERDLAGATSSASSKLIHGGLRYLEHYAFRLVREALAERAILLRMAPHIIWPLRFVLPHDPSLRSRWLVRCGLFLYDRLGGRGVLPGTQAVRLREAAAGLPLEPAARDGFVYSDCWVQDARLVVLLARDAARRGAEIAPRTALVGAARRGGRWHARLQDAQRVRDVEARVLVNAAGPWVGEMQRLCGIRASAGARLVKGSHIVVPRLHDGEEAYILQNDDRRIVFVLPFERQFSLIGTTDIPFAGDKRHPRISEAEALYLCRAVSRWFRRKLSPQDAVWTYAGIRALYDDHAADASAVTRDYVLDLDDEEGVPALSVFGGKVTTHRRLAEQALDRLAPYLPGLAPAWTARSVLPGGEGAAAQGPAGVAASLARDYPFLTPRDADRLARNYGNEARRILGRAHSRGELGRDFGGGLSEREVEWLVGQEWARCAEDILWRRSKLGLSAPVTTAAALTAYLAVAEGGKGAARNASADAAPLPVERGMSRDAPPAGC
jgi:glycerol-3-phosphate dehydrogenase